MTIEGVSIVDPELAKEMAKGAVARAQLVATTVENEALQKRATATASAAKIAAEGEAGALMTRAAADANAVVQHAEAESRAVLLRATADAERIGRVSAALGSASEAMVRKEMLEAAGGVLRAMDANGSRVFVGADPVAAVMGMLASAGGAALTAARGV